MAAMRSPLVTSENWIRAALLISVAPGGTLRKKVLSAVPMVTISPLSVLSEIVFEAASIAVISPITWVAGGAWPNRPITAADSIASRETIRGILSSSGLGGKPRSNVTFAPGASLDRWRYTLFSSRYVLSHGNRIPGGAALNGGGTQSGSRHGRRQRFTGDGTRLPNRGHSL